jgi:hypothetical protein
MSGCHETISKDLARYFYRKLVVAKPAVDFVDAEPEGYHSTWCSETRRCVLRHVASGIRVNADAIDLIERVDRRKVPEPTSIVFAYFSTAAGHNDVFREVAELANTRPRLAWQTLVEHGLLKSVSEGSEKEEDELAWFSGPLTMMDPAHVLRRTEHRVMPRTEEPWHGADFCIAFHVASRCMRPATGAMPEVVQLLEPTSYAEDPEKFVEQNYGAQLIEAAARRDAAGVRKFLELRADPNSIDNRGWTALHAASIPKPAWDVFELLLPVCNMSARTRAGLLPVDLADQYGQDETAALLRQKMRHHPKHKHLVR